MYDYHKFLGAGSFGFVVSAVDRTTGEHVALKVNFEVHQALQIVDATKESSVTCIRKEAEILAEIPPHPNVIAF